MINKEPIYQQLNRLLKQKIESGEFRSGEKFLTERVICDEYDVSRATANKSISNLVSEGLLEFRKGVGTFVKSPSGRESTEPIVSFTDNVRKAGHTPHTRVLVFEQIVASDLEPELAKILKVTGTDGIYRVERLRLADDMPMILENRLIVAALCPNLLRVDLEGSLYALFSHRYHLRITSAEETIQATTLDKRTARILEIEEGRAAFRVTSVGFVDGETPLWWERTIHRPDGLEYRCRVSPAGGNRVLHERLILGSSQTK